MNGGRNASCAAPATHNAAHCTGYIWQVSPIGMAKAERIFFDAFTDLPENADMCAARTATLAVAQSDYPETLNAVTTAWNAVGVCPDPDPPATGPLNDTGITWCANATTNNLTCPVAGFPGQDGEYGRDVTHNDDSDGHAGFSFTKISNSGNALSNSATLGIGANDWGCTRDNVTGLTWEVKTDNGGLRDQDWTYSWYNPDAATNGGFAGYADSGDNCFNTGRCDTDKFVADVKAQGLCGASDWRLPNRFELESLTTNDRYYPNPTIDTAFFPNTPSSWFWSSSPYAYSANDAWGVNFSHGVGYGYKSNASYVRLVRGGQ